MSSNTAAHLTGYDQSIQRYINAIGAVNALVVRGDRVLPACPPEELLTVERFREVLDINDQNQPVGCAATDCADLRGRATIVGRTGYGIKLEPKGLRLCRWITGTAEDKIELSNEALDALREEALSLTFSVNMMDEWGGSPISVLQWSGRDLLEELSNGIIHGRDGNAIAFFAYYHSMPYIVSRPADGLVGGPIDGLIDLRRVPRKDLQWAFGQNNGVKAKKKKRVTDDSL